MRATFVTLAAALALAAGGCGGEAADAGSAADAIPASVVGFAEIDADLESDQWEQVQELLDRFPSRPQLMQELNEALREEGLDYERDVEPALGDTVAVVWRSARSDDAVVLTEPDDEEKLRQLVQKLEEEEEEQTLVVGTLGDWTAVAEEQATIDALANSDSTLADDDDYSDALDELPDERLATFWARRDAFASVPGLQLDWLAGALEARDDGAAALFVASGAPVTGSQAYESRRVDEAPATALAFASFSAEDVRKQQAQLAPFEEMSGLPISGLVSQLRGEGAVWARVVDQSPEVTLVVDVEDERRAEEAAQQLLGRVPAELTVDVSEGRLVATTARSVEAALRRDGSLGDSEDFRSAVEEADMPDETSGFLYVNVADAVPLLSLAQMAGAAPVPPEVLENLRPIRSVVAWSEVDGDRVLSRLFVHID